VKNLPVSAILILALAVAVPNRANAQASDAGDWKSKLRFHAASTYGPKAIVGFAAYAGVSHGINSPEEWGRGSAAYGKRVASAAGSSAIRGVLAFGLDSTTHQDPRFYRSGRTGFWSRTGSALRGTILTRTDRGGETLSTWRIGSAYGAAFLSNQWYPDRLQTVRHGFSRGSLTLGFDLLRNVVSEFWPDLKGKVHRGE
jgi:hypothetical protein